MSANATWGVANTPRRSSLVGGIGGALGLKKTKPKQGNAQWGDLLNKQSSGGGSSSSRLDAFNLLSQKLSRNKSTTDRSAGLVSASTSALSNLPYQSYRKASQLGSLSVFEEEDPNQASPGADAPPQKLQLRKETLMSLGISTMSIKPNRGCLKKSSRGGMSRASTLCSLREMEVLLPSGQTLKRNTSITFKEKVRVKNIPSSSSLAENPEELWYQDDEMKSFRENSKALIALAGDESEKRVDNLRGLERYLPENRAASKNRKYDTWDSVLDTQEFQRRTGTYDDEKIAIMVRAISNQSLQDAQKRARQDATAILG